MRKMLPILFTILSTITLKAQIANFSTGTKGTNGYIRYSFSENPDAVIARFTGKKEDQDDGIYLGAMPNDYSSFVVQFEDKNTYLVTVHNSYLSITGLSVNYRQILEFDNIGCLLCSKTSDEAFVIMNSLCNKPTKKVSPDILKIAIAILKTLK